MIKLLLVSTVAPTISAFLEPFARHYRSRGWRVEAASQGIAGHPGLLATFDEVHELPLTRNPVAFHDLARAAREVRRLVAAGQFDIVHVHTPVAALIVRFALRKRLKLRPIVIYTAHGFHFHRNGSRTSNLLFRAIEQAASRWCDAIVTINKEDFDSATRLGFAGRIVRMPGIGISTSDWSPARVSQTQLQTVRDELSLSTTDTLFLMVAEFNRGKRHGDVLSALRLLDDPTVHVAFAGEGPLKNAIQQAALRDGLEHQTHFLGFRRDIKVLMRASRAVLLPSEREGLPRSLLEALSLQVPIIGADARGTRELAALGGGLLHPIGDKHALAHALTQMRDQVDVATAMGVRGRERVADEYEEAVVLAAHDSLYEELLAARARLVPTA